jgi:uncharacterized protein (TIRG00374 family)
MDIALAARAVAGVQLPHLAVALGLVALDRVIMIGRWVRLLRASGVEVRTRKIARIFLVSEFVSSGLVGAVGADAVRAYSLGRHTAEDGEALASVIVDRLLGTLSLALMAVVGLLAWPSEVSGNWRALAAITALLGLSVGAFWADHVVKAVLAGRAEAGPIGRALVRLTNAVSRYRGRGPTLAAVFALSVGIQVNRIVGAWILGLGLGLTVPFAYYLWFMPLSLLIWLLPVSVAGFGLPQGAFVWMLRPVGVPDETAFALSTLIIVTGLTGNIPGLLLWLRRDREIL